MRPEKWQWNAIFEAVAGGLDARECTLEYDDSRVRITHVPSKSSFLLEGNPGHYTATAVVGDAAPRPSESFTWAKVEERVQQWAEEVERDVATPDLWADLQRERQIITGARYEDVENTPFTSEEQAEIAQQLRQIKEFVRKTYPLSETQVLDLEARLDVIEAAAGRIGRKDWLLLVGGVMAGVIITDLLPPGAVRHILLMLLHGLEHLFGGWDLPPQLPPLRVAGDFTPTSEPGGPVGYRNLSVLVRRLIPILYPTGWTNRLGCRLDEEHYDEDRASPSDRAHDVEQPERDQIRAQRDHGPSSPRVRHRCPGPPWGQHWA
jgi:hypothetical protein